MLKFLNDVTTRTVYEFRIRDYWTPTALALFISIFFTFGASLPLFALTAYISIKREYKVNDFRHSYDNLDCYQRIDEMINNGDIDKEKLSRLIRIVEQNNFEQLGYSLDLKHEGIQAVIAERVTPYKKSFYVAGTLLNNESTEDKIKAFNDKYSRNNFKD